ncbi:MAG: peptide chain release factor N(5)-glutamine methyltransferase, partial [Actinomycetota bacterium]|nr:peptide chain release factor N(5)-glutamine methyltransferase [Actinomycetota bacterium]
SSELLRSVPELPDHEVRRLLAKATGRHWTALILGVDLTTSEVETFRDFVSRRRAGEPLQYIEGTVEFGPIEVAVDPRVLIPRPETEQLYEIAEVAVEDPMVIVDLCTGSGNLAIALKHTFPAATIYATDISADAVDLARENVRQSGLDVTVLLGDLFEPLPDHIRGRVDLIVSNPPYLAAAEVADLPVDVRDHEPITALVAGPVGDEVLARIGGAGSDWLRPGGVVICEISEFHGPAVADRFASLGGEIRRDLSGKERFVIGVAQQ